MAWKPYPDKNTELVAPTHRAGEYAMDLRFQQIALGDKGMGAPRQPHEEVTVRDTTGYLVSTDNGQAHGVSWQESGTAVNVSTSGMTREETLRIVEGMKPASD